LRSRCSTVVSCYEISLRSRKNAKFPVKFPVSREFTWRTARSALRRQPGSPRFREFSSLAAERPANSGLFSSPIVSGDRCSNFSGRTFPKVSSRIQENSRFPETCLGDQRIKPLRARLGSAFSSECPTSWTKLVIARQGIKGEAVVAMRQRIRNKGEKRWTRARLQCRSTGYALLPEDARRLRDW
jgi:hypothetical protein